MTTPVEVAHAFDAHRIGEGKWKVKCPLHQGRSDGSLSITAADDGKTLLRCWAGCPTEDVLAAADLGWEDLFPPSASTKLISKKSSSSKRISDPKIALQHKTEKALREWKEKVTRIIGYRVWLRHRLIAKAEKLIDEGREERGLDLMELGYLGLSRLTWLADLLDSKNRDDWEETRTFWGVEL